MKQQAKGMDTKGISLSGMQKQAVPFQSLSKVQPASVHRKEFNITISDEDAAKLEKVGDAVAYIEKAQSK